MEILGRERKKRGGRSFDERIAGSALLFLKQGPHFRPNLSVIGTFAEVIDFVRIGEKIEELRASSFGVSDQFPTAVGDSALHVAIGSKENFASRTVAAREKRCERATFGTFRHRDAGEFADGWGEVVERHD